MTAKHGVFCLPAALRTGAGTSPSATGPSGQMGQPNYGTAQGAELIFLHFDRTEGSLDAEL